jgi:anti-anti-sigma factor
MTLQLPKLDVPVLAADAVLADTVVTARFRGTADSEAKPALDHYVEALHEEARRVEATKVVIDFRELEFMNSSSFKVFVTWLAQVQELPANEQYRIHFLSNPSMHWQRRSLAALSCFAVNLVTIET